MEFLSPVALVICPDVQTFGLGCLRSRKSTNTELSLSYDQSTPYPVRVLISPKNHRSFTISHRSDILIKHSHILLVTPNNQSPLHYPSIYYISDHNKTCHLHLITKVHHPDRWKTDEGLGLGLGPQLDNRMFHNRKDMRRIDLLVLLAEVCSWSLTYSPLSYEAGLHPYYLRPLLSFFYI